MGGRKMKMEKARKAARKLCKEYGLKLSNRIADNLSYMYDGETLATRKKWRGKIIYLGATVLLHELGHFDIAGPFRNLPEYGLAVGITHAIRIFDLKADQEGLISKEEQELMELYAQAFSVFWSEELNIPFDMENWHNGPKNIKEYWELKLKTDWEVKENKDSNYIKILSKGNLTSTDPSDVLIWVRNKVKYC